MVFKPRAMVLKGKIILWGSSDQVFELFSPSGEKLWVPDWDPELLYPVGVQWKEGLLFRTREETGDAVWVISRLNRAAHEVTYHRVEPDRYVARIDVRCSALPERKTEAAVTYTFVGLSDRGNGDIAKMTQTEYDKKMQRWENWMNGYLQKPKHSSV
jgi:hypothetical protein